MLLTCPNLLVKTLSSFHIIWYSVRSSQRSLNSIDDNPALVEVKEYVHEMYTLEEQLVDKIDTLPLQGDHINALDQVIATLLILL